MGRFLSFIGIEARAQQGSVASAGGTSPLAGVIPPARSTVTDVSVDRALTIPAVYSAVSIITTTVAQLKLSVWRNGEEIPTPYLVRRPDVDQSLSQFLKRTVFGLATTGNAYWHVIRAADGTTASLSVLNPLAISIRYGDRGQKIYDYADSAGGRSFSANQVKHLRLLEVPGTPYGLGPVQAARTALSGAMDLSQYAEQWFRDGAVPTGVLSTDQQLNPDDAAAMKARWHETQASRDVAVLGKGLTYAPIILNPADAQFLESRQYSVTDIARLFRVPASYLLAEVNGSSLTYSNLEQVDTAFVRIGLMQYLIEIEDALSDLLVRGQEAKFNLDGLLRPDAKTLAEIHAIYLSANVLSTDEVRAQKGWTGPAPVQPKPEPATAPVLEGDPNV